MYKRIEPPSIVTICHSCRDFARRYVSSTGERRGVIADFDFKMPWVTWVIAIRQVGWKVLYSKLFDPVVLRFKCLDRGSPSVRVSEKCVFCWLNLFFPSSLNKFCLYESSPGKLISLPEEGIVNFVAGVSTFQSEWKWRYGVGYGRWIYVGYLSIFHRVHTSQNISLSWSRTQDSRTTQDSIGLDES